MHYTASDIITLKQVSGLKLLKYNSINMSKLYYYLLIIIELYFSNFRPLTYFSVMIPEAVYCNFDLMMIAHVLETCRGMK